jgi:DNA-binding XRE family transcriptional regulator
MTGSVNKSREESMRILRERGVTDRTIGKAFGVTPQRVGAILGAHPVTNVKQHIHKNINLPEYLKLWRARNGVTQAALANMIGVNTHTLAPWEQGRVKCSLPRLLVRYLDMLERDGLKNTDK